MIGRRVILALDVATTTGMCEGEPGDRPKFSHASFFADGDHCKSFLNARRWIEARLSRGDVAHACLEAPLRAGAARGHTNADTTMRLVGLWAVFSSSILNAGIGYSEMSVGDIGRAFLGSGTFPRNEAKTRAKLMCEQLGWNPQTLDEADAGALWWCVTARMNRKLTPEISPLLHSRVGSAFANASILRGAKKGAKPKARGLF